MSSKLPDDVALLRAVYRRLDREGLIADCPALTEETINDFFQRMAAKASDNPKPPQLSPRPQTQQEQVIVYSDGGSRGNPGPAGYGAVVTDTAGTILAEISDSIGTATNNVAEYRGLIAGLEAAGNLGASTVLVRADSELLVRQLNGQYKVKSPNLKAPYQRAVELLQVFDHWRIEHIPREQNAHADRLANEAMDRSGA